ncbi:hypothetical protein BH09PSE1_BH09PSE1_16760 [soil metagenome]
MSADPDLLATWARGWSLTRGVAAPVRDRGAWRIDVGWPDQVARFVYADAGGTVAERAEEITTSFVFLKVCAEAEAVRPLLPEAWGLQPPGFLMTLNGPMAARTTHPGVATVLEPLGAATLCRAMEGEREVARGRAVMVDGRIVYDRISVDPGHRRRGLGGLVMRTLEAAMRERGGRDGVLVATADGRALYQSLGWTLHSPYTTAVIPG